MSEHGERNRLIELLASFIELQRLQLEQGAQIMGALANLQDAVAGLTDVVNEAIADLGSGSTGGIPSSAVQAVADQLDALTSSLEDALPSSPGTSTATGPATSTSTASASSSATATDTTSTVAAARARPRRARAAAAAVAEPAAPFRG